MVPRPGLKRFCEGVGENTIDIANASRRIKEKEIEKCAENGVTDIIEVRIGYDGIVFASDINGTEFEFTPTDWFLALSDTVPMDGKLVANPNRSWSQVNSAFPNQPIQAFVPGTKHGTREVFEDKVILAGCEATGAFDILLKTAEGDSDKAKKKAAEKACIALRTDGLSVDIDGDYTETLARIVIEPRRHWGVLVWRFTKTTPTSFRSPPCRVSYPRPKASPAANIRCRAPLYFYVKQAHIGAIPGLKEYAEFFVMDEVAGPDGPLAEYGLVADPELEATQSAVSEEKLLANGM